METHDFQQPQGGITNASQIVWKEADGYTGYVLQKRYDNDTLIGVPAAVRQRREVLAYLHTQRTSPQISPRLVSHDSGKQVVEIELLQNIGVLDNYLPTASEKERKRIFQQAGELTRQIHTPVNVDAETYLERYYHQLGKAVLKASPLLSYAGIQPETLSSLIQQLIDSDEVAKRGVTRVHRDIWMNNFLYDGENVVGIVDWEHAGIGSPYEDFAIFNLWVERVHEDTDAFWDGYGEKPDPNTLRGYLLAKCTQFLSIATIDEYKDQERQGEGYLLAKTRLIRKVMEEDCVV